MKRNFIFSLVVGMIFSFSAAQAQVVQDDIQSIENTMYLPALTDFGNGDFSSCQTSVQPLEGWHPLENLYTPFASYTLTYGQQLEYLNIINKIWPWNYSYMQPWEVNDEMVDIVNMMLEEIIFCSRLMLIPDYLSEVYLFFLDGRSKRTSPYKKALSDYAEYVEVTTNKIFETIDLIEGENTYKACVDTAAWYWKSPFHWAYLDF